MRSKINKIWISALLSTCATNAYAQTINPAAAAASKEEAEDVSGDIIVTAQRREESAQHVPIAISAFSQKSLQAQRVDGGSELVRAVPNVTFAKSYFEGFNFQIRGVGTQLGTASGDAGVGIHLNNVPLTVSRFFEDEFFDTSRVEVLRGPQGTLYGRNATGGVVNVVTAKPSDVLEASMTGEVGTYDTYRARGMVNIPMLDGAVALRLAGSYLNRGGTGINLHTQSPVNDRKLWSGRATLRIEPVDGMEITGMWQHFQENDNRSRVGGLICVPDNGHVSVAGVAVTNPLIRGYLSQGCADASIYSSNRNGAPSSLSTIFGILTQTLGATNGDYNAGKTTSFNLNDIDAFSQPRYKANSDIFQLNVAMQITPQLKFTAISSYLDDHLLTTRDFSGSVPTVPFNNTPLTPGGLFVDPQVGTYDRAAALQRFVSPSRQITQEIRLDSSLDGPLNFSIGGIYIDYKTTADEYVQSNIFTLASQAFGVFVDPNKIPDKSGHNYYLGSSPYHLVSQAIFGEVYYKITDRLKLTLGGRYTHDLKSQQNIPVELLAPGTGHPPGDPATLSVSFKEPTGRLALDWRPDIAFTDDSLLYAVAARGYKAGGLNPPASFGLRAPYKPEFVNSLELGSKNKLLNGRLTLNITGFYYDYKNYQVSEIRDRAQEIQNINATIEGLELETIVEPVNRLRLNANLGYLRSRISEGSFVDPLNFTANDPKLTLVKSGFPTPGNNCAVNTAALAGYLATNPDPAAFLAGVCSGQIAGLSPNLDGIKTSVVGKQLPNAPNWTLSFGAEYSVHWASGWEATLRADYYRQSGSFTRLYNSVGDRLRGWDNVNTTLTVANSAAGWQLQAYVKNIFNNQPIVNTFLADQITGFEKYGFTNDPRIIGLAVTKSF